MKPGHSPSQSIKVILVLVSRLCRSDMCCIIWARRLLTTNPCDGLGVADKPDKAKSIERRQPSDDASHVHVMSSRPPLLALRHQCGWGNNCKPFSHVLSSCLPALICGVSGTTRRWEPKVRSVTSENTLSWRPLPVTHRPANGSKIKEEEHWR